MLRASQALLLLAAGEPWCGHGLDKLSWWNWQIVSLSPLGGGYTTSHWAAGRESGESDSQHPRGRGHFHGPG